MNDTRYRDQVARALRAIEVTSPTSYAWFGRASPPVPRAVRATLPPGRARGYLVERISRELYRSFYIRGRAMPHQVEEVRPPRDHSFVERLSASNAGRGGWEPGWHVQAETGSILEVARDGLRVRVPASECRRHRDGLTVSVRRLKEHRAASPGYYVALCDVEPSHEALDARVYFHVDAEGAAMLVASVTRLLNETAIPFSLKVLAHPWRYGRCDAAIVYLPAGEFLRARGALCSVIEACQHHLRPDVPAFAKRLRRGVAVGEHRASDGGSFGPSRCRLVADGIVDAHERRMKGLGDRLDAVARCFAASGRDLDAPYLEQGSSDIYQL